MIILNNLIAIKDREEKSEKYRLEEIARKRFAEERLQA